MIKKKLVGLKAQLCALAIAGTGIAGATGPADDLAATLTGTITTYGTALTAVVVAGVVMRFTWKWIRSVR